MSARSRATACLDSKAATSARTASDTSTRDGQLLLRNIYKLAERLNKKVGDRLVRLADGCVIGDELLRAAA